MLGLQFLPHRELKLGVGGGAERLQALEPHVSGPVGFEEFRRGVAEAQAPFHGALADAEPRGDLRDRRTVAGQLRERLHLVGRVHGHAHDVFRQGQFRGGAGGRQYLTGDGMIGPERTVVGQGVQGRQTPAAGDNLEAVCVVALPLGGLHEEILEQAVGGDGGLELVERPAVGGRLSHILGRGDQRLKGDALECAFGIGHG